MIMLISSIGTMTQTRMGLGRVEFPVEGPIRGQNLFFMTKSQSFCNVFYFQFLFLETQPLISLE